MLLVGAGGIGAPAALALAAAGVRAMRVVDDDRVELTNLHRQILFSEADVGRPKLEAFADALGRRFPGAAIEPRSGRFVPGTAMGLLEGVAVVVDATDNFASRFLIADACRLAGAPVVHAAAIRWRATVIAAPPRGRPCYRCLFEAPPEGPAPDCATAGVVGPVCGVAGALAADRALAILAAPRGPDGPSYGSIATYDGRADRLRVVPVAPRAGCPLCGDAPGILTIEAARYVATACEAGEAAASAGPWDQPAESVPTAIDPRFLRQVLLPEIGHAGQARIARAPAAVLPGGPGAAALAHEVAARYARGAGFGALEPGAIDVGARAPEGAVRDPAAREVLAGSRAALAAIRAAIGAEGAP